MTVQTQWNIYLGFCRVKITDGQTALMRYPCQNNIVTISCYRILCQYQHVGPTTCRRNFAAVMHRPCCTHALPGRNIFRQYQGGYL